MSRLLITVFVLIGTAFVNYGFSKPKFEAQRRPLQEFPKKIGDWKMAGEQKIEEDAMDVLQVDDYLMRTYVDGKGNTIGFYVGYFKTQREGKEVHSPRQCLPGAGWVTIEHKECPIRLKDHNPSEGVINLNIMGKGADRELYLWWYQGRGRIYADEYLNKIYLMWDAMTKHRTDGALVRINSRIESTVDETLRDQMEFIRDLIPQLPIYIPN